MPFIVPRYKRFFHDSKYFTLESSGDFHLQERKQKAVGSTPIAHLRRQPPTYRMTHLAHGKRGFYVLAEGENSKEMLQGPWKYIVNVLPSKLPEHLSRDRVMRWLLGHFTQLAMESGNSTEKGSDDEMSSPEIFQEARKQDKRGKVASQEIQSVSVVKMQPSRLAVAFNTWLRDRDILLLMLFSGILAYFLRDPSLFAILMAVMNMCVLISFRSSIQVINPYAPKLKLSNPPQISRMDMQFGPDAEIERRALLRRADVLEDQIASYGTRPPTGDVADELSVIYQAIANLTVGGTDSDTISSRPIHKKRKMPRDLPKNASKSQSVGTAATATKTSVHPPQVPPRPVELSKQPDGSLSPKQDYLLFEGLNAAAPRFAHPYASKVSAVKGSKFKLRGLTYPQDSVKVDSGPPIYDFIGWDAFDVKSKFYHASRFMTIPLPPSYRAEAAVKKKELSPSDFETYVQDTLKKLHTPVGGLPRNFILNLQAPNYDPFIYGGPWDGKGFAVTAYFHLSDAVIKQLESSDGVSKTEDESVAGETKGPATSKPYANPNTLRLLQKALQSDLLSANDRSTYLGRTKVCPVCFNLDEVTSISSFLRNSLARFNGKPLLAAPKQKYYRGHGYMELTLDLHVYNYLQRSLSAKSRSMYSEARLGLGICFEGRGEEELPEQMMACAEIDQLDFLKLTPMEQVYTVPDDRTPGHDICAT